MIEIKNLNKTYDSRSRHAQHVLRDLSLTLPDTGFVCILGASGCGKTTLLNAIGGLDTYDNGEIIVDGVAISRFGANGMELVRNRSFGYIFQNYYLLSEHSVGYNVYLGLHNLDLSHREKLKRVRQALAAVDMERYARRLVNSLSGGQQQRVAIARALARRPRVIFADEPTGNLDEANTMNICTLLRQISHQSLVVMVTHEERIARFFADRIITVDTGGIKNDETDWRRGSMLSQGGDSRFYAGDYEEQNGEQEGFSFRLLHEPGVKELKFTILALADRIVLQLDDPRTLTTSDGLQPVILEGKRPSLTLEDVDRSNLEAEKLLPDSAEESRSVPGKGLTFSMLTKEAARLWRTAGIKQVGVWIFLVALTVLTTWIIGDFMTLSRVNPDDFIRTDSHVFSFTVELDENSPYDGDRAPLSAAYREFLKASGINMDFYPVSGTMPRYSSETFLQVGSLNQDFGRYSYSPLSRLDPSTIIYGKMAENSDEIVVDRRVLQTLLDKGGILQSGMTNVAQFLGVQLQYGRQTLSPTIVGICDSGEYSVYMTPAALISCASGGKAVMGFEEFARRYPDDARDIDLTPDTYDYCVINITTAGNAFRYQEGRLYSLGGMEFRIAKAKTLEDCYAIAILRDEDIARYNELLLSMNFMVYADDPDALTAYAAQQSPAEKNHEVRIKMVHEYANKMRLYTEKSHIKADARVILTFSVIALAMVMLYLLQRSRIYGRIGMLAVYRLLGIPGRKLLAIFTMESFLLSLTSSLPAAALTYGVFRTLTELPSVEFSMYLPWYAAALVYLATLVYQLLVTTLPAWRLLRLPPSRLASKYDF